MVVEYTDMCSSSAMETVTLFVMVIAWGRWSRIGGSTAYAFKKI